MILSIVICPATRASLLVYYILVPDMFRHYVLINGYNYNWTSILNNILCIKSTFSLGDHTRKGLQKFNWSINKTYLKNLQYVDWHSSSSEFMSCEATNAGSSKSNISLQFRWSWARFARARMPRLWILDTSEAITTRTGNKEYFTFKTM